MTELTVALGDRSYPVRIGPWRDWDLRALARSWNRAPWALVVDRRAWEIWSQDVLSCLGAADVDAHVLELSGGESSKEHPTLQRVYDHLLTHRIRRDGTLAVFGGGVLGDVAGFAAATWQRGIRFVQIPTTLLAQVDSSVGGKTGVNYREHKNLIGCFHQPSAVLISPEWLNSLPPREFRSGLAEVIKCGVIRDPELLSLLEAESPERIGHSVVLEEVLARALTVKAEIVAEDERDRGMRRLLNFGHTVGHALESATGFSTYLHGEAVAIGMLAALHLSVRVGGLPAADLSRVERLLTRYGLETRSGAADPDSIFRYLELDKKVEAEGGVWVLTERLGTATVAHRISEELVREAISSILAPPMSS